MSRQIQIRRGTATQHSNFTGAIGEVTMDTTNNTLRVHDGVTQGGNEIMSTQKFYSYTTNCVIEIPQDIKILYSGNTLTVKKGSKLYVPNGTGVFDTVVLSSNQTFTASSDGEYYLFRKTVNGTDIVGGIISQIGSGTPGASTWGYFYDTTANRIDFYNPAGTRNDRFFSLPICKMTVSNSTITDVQVFNGFGYVGAVAYALPGIKCLIPDGRNSDGTLNNVIHTTSAITMLTTAYNATLLLSRVYGIQVPYYTNYADDKSFPTYYTNCEWYNPDTNEMYHVGSGAVSSRTYSCVCCKTTASGGKVTDLTINFPARIIDYSNSDYISHQAMPGNRYTNLTLGASGNTYTAPADGYYSLLKGAASNGEWAFLENTTNGLTVGMYPPSGMNGRAFMPVSKGDVIKISYALTGSGATFKFVYVNGSK